MELEIVKDVAKWGNSAGILLPKEWLGNQVKVILIDRTLEIKKEVINILEPYLEDIIGIYLVGSRARNEHDSESDVDILAISKNIKKEIKSGKYEISIITLNSAKNALKTNPILILPRLWEAKTILNNFLLEELLAVKLQKNPFKLFIEESKRIIKMDKTFISIDKLQGLKDLDSVTVIYSSILRLRGVSLIRAILNKKRYSKKEFLRGLVEELGKGETEKAYNIYKSIRDSKKVKEKISIETAEKLNNLLGREIKKLQEKK